MKVRNIKCAIKVNTYSLEREPVTPAVSMRHGPFFLSLRFMSEKFKRPPSCHPSTLVSYDSSHRFALSEALSGNLYFFLLFLTLKQWIGGSGLLFSFLFPTTHEGIEDYFHSFEWAEVNHCFGDIIKLKPHLFFACGNQNILLRSYLKKKKQKRIRTQ